MSRVIKAAKGFASGILKEQLPSGLCFHNWIHTAGVAKASYTIGSNCGLSDEDLETVVVAAWFHDTGFKYKYLGHEEESIKMARSFLRKIGYAQANIVKVTNCIAATRMPQCPHTTLQQVLCDADMLHLSGKNYMKRLALLRWEWYAKLNKLYTNKEWIRENLKFLRKHKYYTAYARDHHEKGKVINSKRLEALIEEA